MIEGSFNREGGVNLGGCKKLVPRVDLVGT